ncbi:MAG: PAS domain-containing protein, partial [Sphingomonadaceae bacterium]|nr:PAS domain-containing protein [Sphingomonadaceae bacterium]
MTAPGHDPAPLDEALRAAAIAAFDFDSFAADPALERITGFAAHLCEAPIALVSLVEKTRQRFLARTGLDAAETPRSMSFCAHAMRRDGIMEVVDPANDPDFRNNPLVTGPPHIAFYASAPLITEDGVPLGALCVIDDKPRSGLTALQREGLEVLAAAVMRRLGERRSDHVRRLAASDREARSRLLADAMPQMVWSSRPDGYTDYFSARWYEFTGLAEGETDGFRWPTVLHAEDRQRAGETWQRAIESGNPYETEYRMRRTDGEYRWVLARGLPLRGTDGAITRWIGTCTDIHEQKLAQAEREVISQELSHRIKNIFSVIAGLVTFAARSRPGFGDIAADLRDRIMALGRAHDFVRPHSVRSRTDQHHDKLHGLLTQLFAPYRAEADPRVLIAGDDVPVDDRSATP